MSVSSSSLASSISANITLRTFAEEYWMPYARKNKRSWKNDERYLAGYILPHIGNVPLSLLNAAALESWLDTLRDSGFSPSSRQRVFWLVKSMLNYAANKLELPFVAADFGTLKPEQPKRRAPNTLSQEEAAALAELLQHHAARPAAQAIHLLLLTGASKSELLFARWEDLDTEKRVLRSSHTPSGRARDIPLNDEAMDVIARLPRMDGVAWLFFTRPHGRRLTSLYPFWDKIRRELGRPDMRLNDLRHSFARLMLDSGRNRKEVKNMMGHYLTDTIERLGQTQEKTLQR